MKQLPMLIRREFWENRNVFLWLPAIIVAFNLLMYFFVGVVTSPDNITIQIEAEGDADIEFMEDIMEVDNAFEYALLQIADLSPFEREQALYMGLMSVTGTLFIVLWLVIFFYLLSSLYSDRRDRSVLFWKSMPVSDALTVVVKLLTGVIIVPLVYLAGVVVLQLTGMMIMTSVAIGADVSAWEVLWKPAAYPLLLGELLLAIVFLSLWHLPLFGWLLTVSAFARSVPFVWAVGVPTGVVIAEHIVTNQSRLGVWMGQHAFPSSLVEGGTSMIDNMTSHATSLNMVSAIVVGAVLVGCAIWLRGKADEI